MSDTAAVIVAALVTAGVTLCSGVLQLTRMREQNRIALFERRLSCFRLAQEALSRVLQSGKADGEACGNMVQALQASWFIFPRELSDRLEKTYKRMLKINLHHTLMDSPDPGEIHQDHVKKKYDALEEVINELTYLRDTFEPHMHVAEVGHPLGWVDDVLDWIEDKPGR